MPIRVEQENGQVRLYPEGEMSIYCAAELKDALIAGMQGGAEIEINLSGVSEMDTAGFQLLLLAKREAAKQGKPLRLVAHSPATLEVLDLYNMGGYFGDPVFLTRQGGAA